MKNLILGQSEHELSYEITNEEITSASRFVNTWEDVYELDIISITRDFNGNYYAESDEGEIFFITEEVIIDYIYNDLFDYENNIASNHEVIVDYRERNFNIGYLVHEFIFSEKELARVSLC